MIDDIIAAVDAIPGGPWKVRQIVDDSGDYKTYDFEIYSMDVYTHFSTGDQLIPRHIGSAFNDPRVAMAFAGAKNLSDEVKRLRKLLDHHRIDYTKHESPTP